MRPAFSKLSASHNLAEDRSAGTQSRGCMRKDVLDASNVVDVDEIEHAGLVSEAGTVVEV